MRLYGGEGMSLRHVRVYGTASHCPTQVNDSTGGGLRHEPRAGGRGGCGRRGPWGPRG